MSNIHKGSINNGKLFFYDYGRNEVDHLVQHGKWSRPPAAHLVILANSSPQVGVSCVRTLIVALYAHIGMPGKKY